MTRDGLTSDLSDALEELGLQVEMRVVWGGGGADREATKVPPERETFSDSGTVAENDEWVVASEKLVLADVNDSAELVRDMAELDAVKASESGRFRPNRPGNRAGSVASRLENSITD